MQKLLTKGCILLLIAIFFSNPMIASGKDLKAPAGYIHADKLPSEFTGLVPPGYTLESPKLVKYGTMGSVSFFAKKEFKGRHSIFFSEYHFDLNIKESTSELIKVQGLMYRTKMEQDIQREMAARKKDDSDPITGFDQAELKKYSWGAGVAQRVIHKYMGAGKNPDEIDYSCVYIGLIIENKYIKQFKLTVSGVETRDEADKWAEKAAEKIGKIGLADLEGN